MTSISHSVGFDLNKVVFETGFHKAALQALQPIATYNSPEVRKAIVDLLARIRRHDPDTVEDAIQRGEFPKEIVTQVQAYPPTERLDDLMTWQSINVLEDLFLLGPLRLELQWFLSQALELPKIEDWFALIAKELANLVAGELVFNVPEDAPSRQLLRSRP